MVVINNNEVLLDQLEDIQNDLLELNYYLASPFISDILDVLYCAEKSTNELIDLKEKYENQSKNMETN